MLRWYRADLHIHTCLSPCGDLRMSPKRIIEKAKLKKLDLIGICDHNSAENVQYTINAAKREKVLKRASNPDHIKHNFKQEIKVLPGIEVCSREEVHIVCLFDDIDNTKKLQEIVYNALPKEKNNPALFGEQIIANEFDEVEGYNDRLLIGATNLSLKELIEKVHILNGIAIASHIDRESFSLIGQLGFVPEDLKIDALEVSSNTTIEEAHKRFLETKRYPVIRSSDAHFLEDIGKTTTNFLLEEPTIEEIKKALKNEEGRRITYQ